MGFAPVQRTITRRTSGPEEMTIDLQLGGAPLALSMVEINGGSDAPFALRDKEGRLAPEVTVPNPIAEILALRDTLHLSAVQIVGLTDVAETLRAKNTIVYRNIQTLLAKSQEAGDISQMAGSVALMLEEASSNTTSAVNAAEKLIRREQWQLLPQSIKDQLQANSPGPPKQ